MKSRLTSRILLTVIAITLFPAFVQAFGQATHLYIADHVYQDSDYKNDLYYGTFAPDLQFFVKHPEKWPTAFEDTHYNFVDIRSFATGPEQAAFAGGWFIHDEKDPWGADHYAHIDPAYVINKAEELTGIPLDFAHLAIEVAVDVLLKNEDHQLGDKFLAAIQRHSWKDRNLLTDVLVTREQRTDRLTLILAEMNFRQIMTQYARALSKPSPDDKEAIAEWGVMLAQKYYHVRVTPGYLLNILNDAIDAVKDDYKATVDAVIEQIKANLPSP